MTLHKFRQTPEPTPGGPALLPAVPSSQEWQAKALELLEFAAVRQRLARHTRSPLGAEQALALEPAYTVTEVEHLGQETMEARQLLATQGDVDLTAVADVRTHLGRASKGGVLTSQEVWEVCSTLQAVNSARQALLRRKAARPLLSELAERIPDLQGLTKALAQAVGPQGDVKDSASTTLRELRSDARVVYHRLEELLRRIASSTLGRHVLQEPLVTQRNLRLVLPVKASERGRLPGLVHDVSESGATMFLEPLAAIPLGNRLQELRSAATKEEERILRALSAQIRDQAEQARLALELAAYLDLLMAKARLGAEMSAMTAPVPLSQDMAVRLIEARHPLLPGRVVPLSLSLGPGMAPQGQSPGWRVLLITGPNAGGKTVALKTVGLMALLHQAGIQLPAEAGTVLPVFDAIYADIGDQQSIQRSLSSFTAHLAGLQATLQYTTPHSLVLLDELGASTDPEEGAALGKAVLEALVERGITTVASTHYRELAAFVQDKPGMMNASVELDPATLTPTYRLTVGFPGRSYALAIASRLSLNPRILQRARELLPVASQRLEELLQELEHERQIAAQARKQAEEALQGAEALRAELATRLEQVEQEREEALVQARQEIQERLQALVAQVAEAEEAVKAGQAAALAGAFAPGLAQAKQAATMLRKKLRTPQWQPARPRWEDWLKGLRPGDTVRVRGFHSVGRVLALPDGKGTLHVHIGALRLQVHAEQLSPAPARPQEGWLPTPSSGLQLLRAGAGEPELDVRGLKAEEALARLEPFLDRALLQGLSEVRIVHGAATGALRRAVRERLGQHPAVKSWAPDNGRRGDGSTTVSLA